MEFERLATGESHVVFTPVHRGASTVFEFIESIKNEFRSNQCLALIRDFAANGLRRNSNKYGNLKDGIFELKPGQYRFPYFYDVEKIAVISHGFIKKGRKTPRGEITKAKAARTEWKIWRATYDGRIAIRKATAEQRTR